MIGATPLPAYFVVDACALLALLHREPGAEQVDALLADQAVVCLVHAINLCEVYYDLLRSEGRIQAAQAVDVLLAAGLQLREDMDVKFWQQVGELKVKPGRLALADCFALALANRTGATLVTSAHHEFDRIVTLDLCPIFFIR
jgi:PIN domain nuclease of toxin-antitoxin system